MRLKLHKGIILDVSKEGFDAGAATFGTVVYDGERKEYLLFYTGASDVRWSEASIGLAVSNDGLNFKKKMLVINSRDFGLREAVTPVVFQVKGYFYIVFAGRRSHDIGRRLFIAYSDDILGPYEFIKQLIKPKYFWEGSSIDLGPSAVKLSEDEILVYYSNVSNKLLWNIIFGPRYWLRRIGILRLKIHSPNNIEVHRFERNPLKHLNGSKGSWNESLFCPGYFRLGDKHYLLPAASTYSVGFPYRQYIGLVEDSSPYFQKPTKVNILIDGPREKKDIIPNIKSEIALDTPCPVMRDYELWLYYAVMDRADSVWKMALSIYSLKEDEG